MVSLNLMRKAAVSATPGDWRFGPGLTTIINGAGTILVKTVEDAEFICECSPEAVLGLLDTLAEARAKTQDLDKLVQAIKSTLGTTWTVDGWQAYLRLIQEEV